MGASAVPSQTLKSGRRVTGKIKAFVDAWAGPAKFNLSEAARLAGYGNPRRRGHELAKKYGDLLEAAKVEALKALKMSADEAEQGVADIARDPTHRDRIKALEMFLKMHGKLSDKLQVTVDRATLNKQLDELISTMAAARTAQLAEPKLQEPGLQDGDAPPNKVEAPN